MAKSKVEKSEFSDCDEVLKILKKIEGYYFYYNWTAGQKNMIHMHYCKACNYGGGKNREKTVGKHCVWIGPFKTKDLAKEKVKEQFGKNALFHSCCIQK